MRDRTDWEKWDDAYADTEPSSAEEERSDAEPVFGEPKEQSNERIDGQTDDEKTVDSFYRKKQEDGERSYINMDESMEESPCGQKKRRCLKESPSEICAGCFCEGLCMCLCESIGGGC